MGFKNSDILVTGGAGFIGSHLVEALVDREANVVVADDFSRGRFDRISHLLNHLDVIPVDLTTREGCIRATEKADHVFHLAASVGGIHYIQRENVGGLTPSVLMNHHMLEAARITGVDRFLFASSACIYREKKEGLSRFSEDQALPANPHSTYGWAKILGEIACQAYHQDTNTDCGIVRIFNCYGPQESLDPDSSHVIPSLCRKAIEASDGGAIELFGTGNQERSFIYITDLVEGLLRAMERKVDADPINLGNGDEVVSINTLAETIIDISGKDLSIKHDLSKPVGTNKYAADTSKMKSSLDWTPKIQLEEGLKQVYDWAETELEDGNRAIAKGDNGA